jgi:SAM-dependent methyltransferase
MQDIAFEEESKIEQNHWWFVVRREMFKKYLSAAPKDAAILDVGVGSGSNLRMLKEAGFTNYQGFDFSPLAKKFCEEKNLGAVKVGDICDSGFADNSYDVILFTDVVEHIENDLLALKEVVRILKPNGKIIITAPCFMSLWGNHDVVSMHQRRYLLGEIKDKITQAEMKIIQSYYFNFFLFVPILIFRKLTKIFAIEIKSENAVNSKFLNKIFTTLFRLDVLLAKKIKFPFGVSAFILASKS